MQIVAPIVSLFLMLNLAQPYAEPEQITELLYEELGVEAFIPETDYPISHVTLEYMPIFDENNDLTRGLPRKADIFYKEALGEPIDDAFKQIWEEQNPLVEVIYGEMNLGQLAIALSVYPDSAGTLLDSEIIEIASHEVQYQFLDREGQTFVFMIINFDDIGYFIEYHAQTEQIEAEAKAFAKQIIDYHLQ